MSSLFLDAMGGLTQGLTQFGELQRADTDRKEKARQQAVAEAADAEKLNLEKRRTRTAEDIAGENILASQQNRTQSGEKFGQEKKGWTLQDIQQEVLIKELEIRKMSVEQQQEFYKTPEGQAHLKQIRGNEVKSAKVTGLKLDAEDTQITETAEVAKLTKDNRVKAMVVNAADAAGIWEGFVVRVGENSDLVKQYKKDGFDVYLKNLEAATKMMPALVGAAGGTRRTSSSLTGTEQSSTYGPSESEVNKRLDILDKMGKTAKDTVATLQEAAEKNPELLKTPAFKTAYDNAVFTLKAYGEKSLEFINKGDFTAAKSTADEGEAKVSTSLALLNQMHKSHVATQAGYASDDAVVVESFGPHKPTNLGGGLDYDGKPVQESKITAPSTTNPTPIPKPLDAEVAPKPQQTYGKDFGYGSKGKTNRELKLEDYRKEQKRNSDSLAVQNKQQENQKVSDSVEMELDDLNVTDDMVRSRIIKTIAEEIKGGLLKPDEKSIAKRSKELSQRINLSR